MNAVATRRDKHAFARLFEYFAPRVKAWLMKAGANPALADEVAQETLLTVWRQASRFDSSRAAPSTWIFTIARNKRIERLRKERVFEADPGTRPDADDRYGWDTLAIERGRLETAISDLPSEQARVLTLTYIEGKSHSAIAEQLGVKLGTVKSRLRLAMSSLRSTYGE